MKSMVPGESAGPRTLCLDFDGVLHGYRNGFTPGAAPDDNAVEGAVAFVRWAMQRGYKIVVQSARFDRRENFEYVRHWLMTHGFPTAFMELVSEKPKASLYVDDRGFRFEGPQSWDVLKEMLSVPGGDPGTWTHPNRS